MDIYPSFEVAIAVITFVLGFVSARHHAQLSAARQLIASMDDGVAGTGGPSSRDQVTDLLELAKSGFQRDVIVDATVVAAAVVSSVITVLSLLGPARGWLDPTAAGNAMGGIAVGLAWLVTLLGTADAVAVRRGLRTLQEKTTVGLLSQAETEIKDQKFDDAIALASLAVTRSPRSALAYLSRARARVEQAEFEGPNGAMIPAASRPPARFSPTIGRTLRDYARGLSRRCDRRRHGRAFMCGEDDADVVTRVRGGSR